MSSTPTVGDRYKHREEPRVVTVTNVWQTFAGVTAVAFEWHDDQPGTSGSALDADLFHRFYEPETDQPAVEPTALRWGLDDVEYGDTGTTTVLLSDSDGAPYWLELDPERTAALREALTGPDAEQPPYPAHTDYAVEVLADDGEWVGLSFRRHNIETARTVRDRLIARHYPDGARTRIVRWTDTATVVEIDPEPEQQPVTQFLEHMAAQDPERLNADRAAAWNRGTGQQPALDPVVVSVAAVYRQAADEIDTAKELRDLTDDHMRDINAAANYLRRRADAIEQGQP
ncbi:hypothetical protein [Streptomyces sp. NPDC002644]